MKKLLLLFFLCYTSTTIVDAKEYKKLRVACGFGYTFSNGLSDFGLLIYLEPSYRLKDNLSVGLRLESAGLGFQFLSEYIHGASYTLNGQYYFGKKKLKPLLGAGLGIFKFEHSYSSSNDFQPGFYFRAGFDVGHFNLSLDYNMNTKSTGAQVLNPSVVAIPMSMPGISMSDMSMPIFSTLASLGVDAIGMLICAERYSR